MPSIGPDTSILAESPLMRVEVALKGLLSLTEDGQARLMEMATVLGSVADPVP